MKKVELKSAGVEKIRQRGAVKVRSFYEKMNRLEEVLMRTIALTLIEIRAITSFVRRYVEL